MSDRIGAATYVHQPLVAIRSLRLAGGSSGVLALAVYSVRTALLRDVIFEPHTWVTVTRADLDHVLRRAVSDWLAASWPFQNPDYAGRA